MPNISAITRHTIVTKRLSVVSNCGEDIALITARAMKPIAMTTQIKFSNLSSLFMPRVSLLAISIRFAHYEVT